MGAGLKVLHVIDSAGLYGAEVMLLNLVDEQVKTGLSPAICSIGEKGCAEKPIEAEARRRGFRVKTFRMKAGFNLKGALDILGFARQEGFGVLHSHGYKGNILFGFMPRRLRRIPVVATLHGWTSAGAVSRMRVYEWLDARALKHIDAVVAVNGRMLANLKLKKEGLRLFVVDNGIPQRAHQCASSDLDKDVKGFCESKGFIIGAIGRLSHEKGFNFLLEAVSILVKNSEDVKLVIIGEGVERERLEKLRDSLDLKERVSLPGYRPDAHKYLSFFDVFVLPSVTEGLPMTVLEAMQYEVPIIASSVGGIPDLLEGGNAGVLVQPKDSNAIAKAIGTLKIDKAYASALAKKSKEAVKVKYSSERMAAEYLGIYNTLFSEFSQRQVP